jgi:hypothetical protein
MRPWRDSDCGFKIKHESSAHNDTFVFKPWISYPLILFFDLILTTNISMAIINKYADSGQPCFTPLDSFKLSEPLFTILHLGLLYITLTHFIRDSPKM